MATEVGKGIVKLEADGADLAKDIEKKLGGPVAAAADKAGREAGKKFAGGMDKESSQALVDFGKKGLAATAIVAGGLFAAASAAGSLDAAISANEQILGDASNQIIKWSENSVDAVGLSQRAAIEAATSFGQLGKIAGEIGPGLATFSQDLVGLAADMAAFKDVPVEQALSDLQSGFAGSTEVLRKYGIFLDDAGLKTAYFTATGREASGVLTAQERVIATHQAIMEKSVDMQGQWSRESDGFQAQQSKLKAELENMGAAVGKTVLPVMTDLVGVAGSLLGGFSSLNEMTGGLIGKLALVGAAGLGTVSAFAYIGGKVGKLTDSFTKMSTTLKNMGPAASAGAAAAITAGIAMIGLAVHAQRAAEKQRDFNAAIGELSRVADPEKPKAFNEAMVKGIQAAIANGRALDGIMTDIVEGNIEGARATLAYMEASGMAGKAVDALRVAIIAEEEAQRQAVATTEAHGDAISGNTEPAVRKLTEREKELGAAYRLMADMHAEAMMDRIADATFRAATRAQAAEKATRDWEAAWLNLNNTLMPSLLGVQGQIDSTRAAAETAWAAQVEANAAVASGADDAAAKMLAAEAAQRDYELATYGTRDSVIAFGRELDLLPSEVKTLLNLYDNGQIEEMERRLQILTRNRDMNVTIVAKGGVGYGDISGVRAAGGPVREGESYVVGDGGVPEVFSPDSDGYVWPSVDSYSRQIGRVDMGAAGGAVTYDIDVHNNGRDVTRDDLATVLTMVRLR